MYHTFPLKSRKNNSCTSRIYLGALEEVQEWHLRAQLDLTFYGAVNMMQACLPFMRTQFFGHYINLTDTTGSIGSPFLSLVAGCMHALEGYLEALACEVAPFNIKVSIVETPLEVSLFTVPAVIAEAAPARYGADTVAGRMRALVQAGGVRRAYSHSHSGWHGSDGLLDSENEGGMFPVQAMRETVHTVLSIGGLENPPGRVIVGKEAIGQIKTKLALLSEDLEEFMDVSVSADYADYHLFGD